MLSLTLLPILLAATRVSAFNCETHTFTQCADNIVHWYDPDDGMICDPLDCGGGRAPAKTDVPCCAAYKGTEACVTSASYLPCFKDFAQSTSAASVAESTPTADATTTAESSAPIRATEAASSGDDQPKPTEASASQDASGAASTTQPPAGSATSLVGSSGNGTSVVSSGSGNATLSGTGGPVVTPSGNAAGSLRYDALVVLAGAVVALA